MYVSSPWEALPSLPVARRRMACGLAIKRTGGEKMIIAAGGDMMDDPEYLETTEVLYWDQKLWKKGLHLYI